jgi:nucleotidyltransferase AbiEii toxin of type IV toxin-antitoxin system
VTDSSLVEKVVHLEQALTRHRIPHAFGGALAFAYYGEPRATVDIDLNIFVDTDQYEDVMKVLEPLGVDRAKNPAVLARDGQTRLWWGRTPVDLFFSYDPLHDAMRDGTRMVPFSATSIPILSPEHLLVAKVIFNRAKDWIDIEQILVAVPALNHKEMHRWLERIIGTDDKRYVRVRALEEELSDPE